MGSGGTFPLPAVAPLDRTRRLDSLAQRLHQSTPAAVCDAGVPTRAALDDARTCYDDARAEMIAWQEKLDWEVCRIYGVLDDDLTYPGDDLPGLALGERAFEIPLLHLIERPECKRRWAAEPWEDRDHLEQRRRWPGWCSTGRPASAGPVTRLAELEPVYGGSPADYYTTWLDGETTRPA